MGIAAHRSAAQAGAVDEQLVAAVGRDGEAGALGRRREREPAPKEEPAVDTVVAPDDAAEKLIPVTERVDRLLRRPDERCAAMHRRGIADVWRRVQDARRSQDAHSL